MYTKFVIYKDNEGLIHYYTAYRSIFFYFYFDIYTKKNLFELFAYSQIVSIHSFPLYTLLYSFTMYKALIKYELEK